MQEPGAPAMPVPAMPPLPAGARHTPHGFAVPRADAAAARALCDALTLRPKGTPRGLPQPPPVRAYRVGASYVYVPRRLALAAYGPASCGVSGDSGESGDPMRPEALAFAGELRPAQAAARDAFLAAARDPARRGGVLALPTGAGKTVVALSAAAALGRRTLVVVHKAFLMDQWRARAAAFLPGASVGRVRGARRELGREHDVVVAMIQTLCVPGKFAPADFAGFGLAVVDECHHVGAAVFSRAMFLIPAAYALGLSATPERRDMLTDIVYWHLGALAAPAPRACDGADRDVVVRVHRFAAAPPAARTTFHRPAAALTALCEDPARTAFVLDCIRACDADRPGGRILVLSDRVAQLRALAGLAAGAGLDAGMYVGGAAPADLAVAAARRVVLGTYGMCAEGFDVPEIDTLVLASPRRDVAQAVGRVLRVPADSRARPPMVVDVVDAAPPLFKSQAAARARLYSARGYKVIQRT